MQFAGLPARAGIALPDVPLAFCTTAGTVLDLSSSHAAVLACWDLFLPHSASLHVKEGL